MQYIDKVLQIEPDNLYALTNKGLVLAQFGRQQEALEYYDRALSIDANYTLALLNRGATLGELGRYEEAIEYFDEALVQESRAMTETAIADITQTLTNEAEGYMIWITNSGDRSKLHYVSVFLTSKTAIDVEANKGIALFHQGKYQEAIDIFDIVLANDDKHIDSLYHKAQSLAKLGFLEEANQYKNLVYQINPNYKAGFIEVVATSPIIQAIVALFQ